MDNLTQFTKIEQTAGRRNTVLRVITYVLLTLWALVVLFPFYWMLLTSVKSYSSYNAESHSQLFYPDPHLSELCRCFTSVPLGRYLLNTLIFTVITTAIMMV